MGKSVTGNYRMALVLVKVVSGGQTGVDQAGLFVARELGYQTGGVAPNGWRTETGPAPWLVTYGLTESWSNGYRERTIDNVRAADFTVWFGHELSSGGRLTIGTCQQFNRPCAINPTAVRLRKVLEMSAIVVLNVAGNRMSKNPKASELAALVLREALASR